MSAREWIAPAITLVVGTGLLAGTLASPPGDPGFYVLSVLLAGCWLAGGLAGRQWAWVPGRPSPAVVITRHVLQPIGLGLALALVFAAGGVVADRVPFLEGRIDDVLRHADGESWVAVAAVTALTGAAEELFFRGALFEFIPTAQRVLATTVIYVLVTIASLNLMLIVAAAILGVVAAVVRERWDGVLAPAVVHVTWGVSMLTVLPVLLGMSGR